MTDEFKSVYEGVKRNRGISITPAVVFYPPNKQDIVLVRVTAPLAQKLGWQPGMKVDLLIAKATRKARIATGAAQEKGWSPRHGKGRGEQRELHIQIKTSTRGVFIPPEKQVITNYREVSPGVIEFDLPEGEVAEE